MRTHERLLILFQFVLAVSLVGPIFGPVFAQSPGYLAAAPAGRQNVPGWQEDGLRLPDGATETSYIEPPLRLNQSATTLVGLVPSGVATQRVTYQANVTPAGGAFLFVPFAILVVVPQDAFRERVTIALTPAANPSFMPVNSAVDLSITSLADGHELMADKPLLLALDLGEVAVSTESFIGRYDGLAGAWYVPAMIKHGAGLISIAVDAPGRWAAVNFGDQAAVEPAPSPWRYQWQVPSTAAFNGAAVYEQAIPVPAGRGGLTPNIDISYSSSLLNGLIFNDGHDPGALGTGWRLNHIEINRSLVTVNEHQGLYTLHHGDAFSLVLDGQNYQLERASAIGNITRYIAVNGPSLKVEFITQDPAASPELNAHGQYWLVTTGNGTVYRLGYLEDAETGQHVNQAALLHVTGVQPSGYQTNYSPLRWNIDTITDVHGNQIQFDYDSWTPEMEIHGQLPNQLLVTTNNARTEAIRYNFSAVAPNPMTRLSTNHASEIQFELTHDKRVDAIRIFHLDLATPNRMIDFDLAASFNDNHPCGQGHRGSKSYLVTAIREVGRGGNQALPATSFGYETFKHSNHNSCYRYQHLTTIENGYGGVVNYDYEHDSRQTPAWAGPVPTYGRSFFVVEQRIFDGVSPQPAINSFTWLTPCYDQLYGNTGAMPDAWSCPQRDDATSDGYPYGNGALVGFAESVQTVINYDGRQLQQTSSHFYQDRRRVGRLWHDESIESDGFAAVVRDFDYWTDAADVTGDGLNDFDFTYTRRKTVTHHNRGGQVNAVTTLHTYGRQENMQYGNETRVETVAYLGGQFDREQVVTRDFFPNRATWIVMAVARERQFDGATLFAEMITSYDQRDWNAGPLKGLPTRVQQLIESGRYSTQSITYDIYGNPEQVTDPLGNVTVTEFDQGYSLYPLMVTNALGHETSAGYCGVNTLCGVDEPDGALRYQTDANGTTAFHQYDSLGRLIRRYRNETEFAANQPAQAYGYHLTVDGLRYTTSWQRTQDDAVAWSTGGSWQREILDGHGRILQKQRPHFDWWTDGAYTGQRIISDVTYDALGRAIKTSAPYLQNAALADSHPYVEPGQVVNQATTQFDSIGRPVRSIDLSGAVNTTLYGLRRAYNVDPNRHLRVALLDDAGQLIGIDEALEPYRDDFSFRSLPGWHRQGNVAAVDGSARLIGNGSWTTSIDRSYAAAEDWGVHFTVRGDNSQQTAYLLNDSGTWGNSDFLRWALVIKDGHLALLEQYGKERKTTQLIPFRAHKTYRVIMRGDAESREYSLLIWRDDRPELQAEVVRIQPPQWTASDWRFIAIARTAGDTLWLDDYAELDFSRTRYAYDIGGNLTDVVDAVGNATTIDYDMAGRKIEMRDPDMGTWGYGYDDIGNLLWQRDNKGQQINFSYDPLHRLTSKSHDQDLIASYQYDEQQLGNAGLGRRTSMVAYQGGEQNSARFFYDEFGQLVVETREIAGQQYQFRYEYSAGGLPVAIYYPGDAYTASQGWQYGEKTVTDYYWAAGLPRSLVGDGIYVDDATYNEAGQFTNLSLGNNVEQGFAYDDALRLQAIDSNLFDLEKNWFEYQYDAAGNILAIVDLNPPSSGSQTQHFTYDAWHRLTMAHTSGVGGGYYNESYAYDALGNLIFKGDQLQSYQSRLPHALTHIHGRQVSWYDDNGNMTQRVDADGIVWSQRWTVENMLARATSGKGSEDLGFFYDGDSQLVLRRDYRRGHDIVQLGRQFQHNLSTDVETRHYAFAGSLVAMRESTEVSFFLRDHLGSTITTLWASGLVRSDRRYKPWGELRWETAGSLTPTGYQFTSQRWDDVLGLYDYNARYYDAETGRFISADSLVPASGTSRHLTSTIVDYSEISLLEGLKESVVSNDELSWGPLTSAALNRYAYTGNNPTAAIDPTGHDHESIIESSTFNAAEASYFFAVLVAAHTAAKDNMSDTVGDFAGIFGSAGGTLIGVLLGLAIFGSNPVGWALAGVALVAFLSTIIFGLLFNEVGEEIGEMMASSSRVMGTMADMEAELLLNLDLADPARPRLKTNGEFVEIESVTVELETSSYDHWVRIIITLQNGEEKEFFYQDVGSDMVELLQELVAATNEHGNGA